MAYEHEVYEPSAEEEEHYETAYDLLAEFRGHGITFRLVDGKVRVRPMSVLSELGLAELRRCKAEVYEILREEDEHAAWWEVTLAAVPETDVLDDAEYEEFGGLTADQQSALFRWIAESIEISPETTERYRHDSYELKHYFERAPEGFYVSDEQFRCAMWLSGFLGRRLPGRRYKDVGTRYYYVRPNPAGLIHKLERAGVPYGWALRYP